MKKRELPFRIGEATMTEERIPGVYYGQGDNGMIPGLRDEYYAIEPDCPHISAEAKTYGRPCGDMLLFCLSEEASGYGVIAYELCKYRTEHGELREDEESLLELSSFYAELYPAYFGAYIPPRHTPRGYTTRWRALMNGVFWLETDRLQRLLALVYPIWSGDLSDFSRRLGEQTEYDREYDIETTYGYLFFTEKDGCTALFELTRIYPPLMKSPLIDLTALQNAVLINYPEYAMAYNFREQNGRSDPLVQLGLMPPRRFGVEDVIAYAPDAGYRYLRL